MIEIIAILVLAVICIAQAVDKYFFTIRILKQLDDAIKASMSRNLAEYSAATREPIKQAPPQEVDEIELSNASDEDFTKYIKTQ